VTSEKKTFTDEILSEILTEIALTRANNGSKGGIKDIARCTDTPGPFVAKL